MKRMVYIILSITGVLLAGILFVGCSFSSPQANKDVSFTGISLSQSHMSFSECYSFYLREEEGKVLFDAEVRFYDEPYEIILESCQVDDNYFKKLSSLDEKHSITEYVNSYKNKSLPVQVMDDTVITTTVYLDDGTFKSAKSGNHTDVLYDFFLELALRYKSLSVAENYSD